MAQNVYREVDKERIQQQDSRQIGRLASMLGRRHEHRDPYGQLNCSYFAQGLCVYFFIFDVVPYPFYQPPLFDSRFSQVS